MKKSSGGLQYVKDFSFPADQGFTGSAGRSEVKGYMRGGSVKKGRNKPNTKSKRAKGTTAAAMGGYMGPEREITVDDVKITTPARPGMKKGGSTHEKLVRHGAKMGYAYGGMVKGRKNSIGATPDDVGLKNWDKHKKKNTSDRFKMKKGKQDTMDTGVQPARRGKNARSAQEAEAGGTGRLKPGLARGGLAKAVHAVDRAAKKVAGKTKRVGRNTDKTKGKGMSKRGMPKNVKAKGGTVTYAQGGVVKKVGAAQ